MLALLLEDLQHPQRRHALRDEEYGPQRGADIERLALDVADDHILGVEDADGAIRVALHHGEARVLRIQEERFDLLLGVLQIDPRDPRARRHKGVDAPFIQPEHIFDHILLGFLEDAYLGAVLDHNLDLLRGDVRFLRGLDAQEAHDAIGGDAEQPDEGLGDGGEGLHRLGDEGGDLLRVVQRQSLGRQLADHQRDVGDAQHDDGRGDRSA